jgi:hypothetical protein
VPRAPFRSSGSAFILGAVSFVAVEMQPHSPPAHTTISLLPARRTSRPGRPWRESARARASGDARRPRDSTRELQDEIIPSGYHMDLVCPCCSRHARISTSVQFRGGRAPLTCNHGASGGDPRARTGREREACAC